MEDKKINPSGLYIGKENENTSEIAFVDFHKSASSNYNTTIFGVAGGGRRFTIKEHNKGI